MNHFKIKNISEILYSVGDLEKVKHFFVDFGGWNIVGEYASDASVIDYWELPSNTATNEILLQSNHHPTGQIRLVKFHDIKQEYIRSSQKPWDTGGIMDINLKVHDVAEAFEKLRELGWHGLSDPLLQEMGPFKLYDVLMKGYDDIIIAFTHRLVPPLNLTSPNTLPTHVYNSSLTVSKLEASKEFYVDQLGCKLLNEYQVKKDKPQETMFGLPFNLADKVTCNANIFSFDGERDVVFQTVAFDGITGKDFSEKAVPPNRGFMTYRVEVEGIKAYLKNLQSKNTIIHRPLQTINISPYGKCHAFVVKSPDGVWWTFYEVQN